MLTYYFTIIALITMFVVKIVNIFKLKKKGEKVKLFTKTKTNFLDLVVAIYAILIMLSAVTSDFFPYTLISGAASRYEGAITLYLYLVLFYLAHKFFNWNEKYLPYLASSTMIASAIGIVQAVLYYAIGREDQHTFMAYSSFGNPNFFSSYLTIFLPIYMLSYLKSGKPFYLISSIVTFGALVCTKTLGGYITFAICFVVILIYSITQKYSFKHIAMLALAFILIFTLLNICAKNTYLKEFISIKDEVENLEEGNENFGTNRGFIFKVSLDIIRENAWLGIGPDTLGAYFIRYIYFTPEYTSNIIYDKAHSEYLQIAVCTGIPSLICYLVIMGFIGIKLFRKHLSDKSNVTLFAVGLSILAYLIQAASNISVTHVAPMFWIMLGIGYGMCKKRE